jgi:hypothetical protein
MLAAQYSMTALYTWAVHRRIYERQGCLSAKRLYVLSTLRNLSCFGSRVVAALFVRVYMIGVVASSTAFAV